MTAAVRDRLDDRKPEDRSAAGRAGSGSRFHLGRGARKLTLTIHIVAAGAWIGVDVVLGVLVFTAMLTTRPDTEALAYRVMELAAVWPLIIAGFLTLASGLVLGLGTRYGLVRYKWVAVKLVLNIVLVTLVVFLLRPGLAEAADYGEALAAGAPADSAAVSQLIFPPLVSGTALLFATFLSVYRPWGRLRKDGRRGERRAADPGPDRSVGGRRADR